MRKHLHKGLHLQEQSLQIISGLRLKRASCGRSNLKLGYLENGFGVSMPSLLCLLLSVVKLCLGNLHL